MEVKEGGESELVRAAADKMALDQPQQPLQRPGRAMSVPSLHPWPELPVASGSAGWVGLLADNGSVQGGEVESRSAGTPETGNGPGSRLLAVTAVGRREMSRLQSPSSRG